MKSLKAIMLAGALATAASASAQFANTGSNTASTDLDDYNRISVSYNNTHFGFNKEAGGSDSDFGLNGFGLNYIHGFSVSSTLPKKWTYMTDGFKPTTKSNSSISRCL